MKARWCVRIILRAIAALLLITALTWAAIRVWPFRSHQRIAAGGFAPDPDVFAPEYFGLPMALVAAACALWLINQFAMGWIIPVPRPNCPSCGYDLAKPEGANCPECGLTLTQQEAAADAPLRGDQP